MQESSGEFDRAQVVVNFNNVGTNYGKTVLHLEEGNSMFHWEGVRRCVRYLTSRLGLRVIGVIFQEWRAWDGPPGQLCEVRGIPEDIRNMCAVIAETPRINMSHQRSADDEMTIKMAFKRRCMMLDNDNYRDWAEHHPDPEIRDFLNSCRDVLHMKYYFDPELGCFETLDGTVRASNGGRAPSSGRPSRPPSGQRPAPAAAAPAAPAAAASAPAGDEGRRRTRHRRRSRSNSLAAEAGAEHEAAPSRPPGTWDTSWPSGAWDRTSSQRRSERRSASRRRGRSVSLGPEAGGAEVAARTVNVAGLPSGADWRELKAHMAQAGRVDFASVARAASRGRGGGGGADGSWVKFASVDEAFEAVRLLDGRPFQGRLLHVQMWAEAA